jgi:hypothetical protein
VFKLIDLRIEFYNRRLFNSNQHQKILTLAEICRPGRLIGRHLGRHCRMPTSFPRAYFWNIWNTDLERYEMKCTLCSGTVFSSLLCITIFTSYSHNTSYNDLLLFVYLSIFLQRFYSLIFSNPGVQIAYNKYMSIYSG